MESGRKLPSHNLRGMMYTPPAHVRKLLCVAEQIVEADAIIVRAMFDSNTVQTDPLRLHEKRSIRRFLPQKIRDAENYEDSLSVIHEDGRPDAETCALAREHINKVSTLAALAKISVNEFSGINTESIEDVPVKLNVYRDDEDFSGHAVIFHFPDDSKLVNLLAGLIKNYFARSGSIAAPA